MAKAQIYFCLIIFFYLSSETNFFRVDGQDQGEWCVAKSSTDNGQLLKNIDYACSKIDCRIILEGGACFAPNTPISHASVAMNLYYQAEGRHRSDCNFEGSGVIAVVDPSFGICKFQYRR